ncbi:MAG: hypothetical protein QXX94_06280 [Candidatus Bathyarchaeia archaeon]
MRKALYALIKFSIFSLHPLHILAITVFTSSGIKDVSSEADELLHDPKICFNSVFAVTLLLQIPRNSTTLSFTSGSGGFSE